MKSWCEAESESGIRFDSRTHELNVQNVTPHCKNKKREKIFLGGAGGRRGSAWRSWTEAMEGRLSTAPQGKLKL